LIQLFLKKKERIMNNTRSIAASKSSADTGRGGIQSRIARYIRGEISATMIATNSGKMDSIQATTNATAVAAAAQQRGRGGLFANKLRCCRIRPPFRNTVNVKNTSVSFLSMVHDIKGMKVSTDESAPELDTICVCKSETVRKFVPEPGFYMQTLRRKLAALQNRNSFK
jgi:hypothetical protein